MVWFSQLHGILQSTGLPRLLRSDHFAPPNGALDFSNDFMVPFFTRVARAIRGQSKDIAHIYHNNPPTGDVSQANANTQLPIIGGNPDFVVFAEEYVDHQCPASCLIKITFNAFYFEGFFSNLCMFIILFIHGWF